MYLGANKAAELSGIFSKLRKKIHKIIPRELSPTRLLEKSQKDKAIKAALKTEVAETQRAAENQVAAAQTAAQVAVLQAQSLPPSSIAPGFSIPTPTQKFSLTEFVPSQSIPVAPVATTAPPSAVATNDNTALYVGLGAAGLLGALYFLGKRK